MKVRGEKLGVNFPFLFFPFCRMGRFASKRFEQWDDVDVPVIILKANVPFEQLKMCVDCRSRRANQFEGDQS